MEVVEIKNNLYQSVGLILTDGTQLNVPPREKRIIKKELLVMVQVDSLKKDGKITYKELVK